MTLSPAENPTFIGHTEIEQTFLDAWARGTMPHSLLFCGPKGVGKATFAFRLARFILSGGNESGGLFGGSSSLDIPPESPVFRRIMGQSHGDFLSITPDEKGATPSIKVDEIRTIGSFLAMTPSESQWRVVIIDAADDMNPNAANALLKVLEEPPSYCMIILISHQPGLLLPTIRSRCRTIPFLAPKDADFSAIVRTSLPRIADIDLQALYVLSYGSPGFALQLDELDAITLYQNLIDTLNDDSATSAKGLAALNKQLANTKQKDLWQAWRHLWHLWQYRLTLLQQGITIPFISEADEQVLGTLCHRLSADALASLSQQAHTLFMDVQTLHLDKKQVIASLFNAIKKADAAT